MKQYAKITDGELERAPINAFIGGRLICNINRRPDLLAELGYKPLTVQGADFNERILSGTGGNRLGGRFRAGTNNFRRVAYSRIRGGGCIYSNNPRGGRRFANSPIQQQ